MVPDPPQISVARAQIDQRPVDEKRHERHIDAALQDLEDRRPVAQQVARHVRHEGDERAHHHQDPQPRQPDLSARAADERRPFT